MSEEEAISFVEHVRIHKELFVGRQGFFGPIYKLATEEDLAKAGFLRGSKTQGLRMRFTVSQDGVNVWATPWEAAEVAGAHKYDLPNDVKFNEVNLELSTLPPGMERAGR